LIDAHSDQYEINHNTKLARLVAHLEEPPHEVIKNLNNLRPSNSRDEAVNGLICAVVPSYYNEPAENPNAKPSGEEYLYLPYGLWVKSVFTNPDGSLLRVRELYDIEIIEPDPALVRIPEGYSIDLQPEQ
jgi:hypothetical protein